MKPTKAILVLFVMLSILPLVSCQGRSGRLPSPTETAVTQTSVDQTPSATVRVNPDTPVGWTGNELQPQEFVYPTETTYGAGVTPQATATPRPSAAVNTPTRTATATPTSTVRPFGPTQTPSSTPRQSPTATVTETQQSGWTGTWVVYYGIDENSLETGSMMVSQTGANLNAVAQFGSLEMTFTGALSQQEQEASGTYTHPTDPGWFYWLLVTPNQFGGVLNDELVFCANRPGGNRPSPCGISPSY